MYTEIKNRISFIEKGRLDDEQMKEIVGGDSCKSCSSCCSGVQGGNGYAITENCVNNLITCDMEYYECSSETSLRSCAEAYAKRIPISIAPITNLTAVAKVVAPMSSNFIKIN